MNMFMDGTRPYCAAANAAAFGFADSRTRSTSASANLFSLARRFWNQILTWVSVRLSRLENSARSEMDKYCFSLNFFSNEDSCCEVNGVLGLRSALCFRRWQRNGKRGGCWWFGKFDNGLLWATEMEKQEQISIKVWWILIFKFLTWISTKQKLAPKL